MRPPRRPISRRAAPSRARLRLDRAGGEEDAVAGLRADVRGEAGPLVVAEVLGHRAAELAVLADVHVGQARARRAAWPTPARRRTGARGWSAPPGITTAPTYGAWKTRNGVSAKYAVQSTSSCPIRRSGLSEPNRAIASAYVIRGSGVGTSYPISFQSATRTSSATREHVVLVDEAHLDVELGELRLPVGAEVLVAVAARDLVVALHARRPSAAA